VSEARTIVFAPEAAKEFDALDWAVRRRVEKALDLLAADPLALRNQIKRLKGDSAMRLRVGDWRVIFDLQRPGEIVVFAIAHRSEVYRSEN
jgi:mRNA interferase RelE/StbE